MELLPLLGLVVLDASVWVVAYRLQEPPRQIQILGANVAVISVNVALIVGLSVAFAIARLS